MKDKVLKTALILHFIAGLAVFLYPIGENYLSERMAQSIISDFDETAQALWHTEKKFAHAGENSAFRELYAAMQAYNLNLYENGQGCLLDPFSYEIPAFNLTEYGFKDNIVGYQKCRYRYRA